MWPDFGRYSGASAGPNGGTSFAPRELARIGYLTLQGGLWDTGQGPRQVVTADRVKLITNWAPFLASPTFREPNFWVVQPSSQNYYGYPWWLPSGKKPECCTAGDQRR